MNVDVLIKFIPDLIACSALLTLAVYHLFIYFGRKEDKKERYNLYFSCFVLSTALFIIGPHFQDNYTLYRWRPNWLYVINIETFTVWLSLMSGIAFLNHLLSVSKKYKRNFYFTFISISLCVLLTFTSNFISKEFYFNHVQIYIMITIGINIILTNLLYGLWIYHKRMFKERFISIIYTGYLLITFNSLIYRFIEIINFGKFFVLYHCITPIILYSFTYALSVKFNKEHNELKKIKLSLETKTKEQPKFNNNKVCSQETNCYRSISSSQYEIVSLDEQFLQKALQVVLINIDKTEFNSERLSKEIGISRAHLHRKLKILTNKSASEFIKTVKLKKAVELLNQKASTVSEIAYNSGFNNLSYFSRCFKEEYGVAPSEYLSNSGK